MDLVCQAEQHCILPATSVQLGRHSRALGVVCLSFVLFVGLGLGIGALLVGPSSTLSEPIVDDFKCG